ncbi:MAG: polysaccharide biosynthesis/export family protein [Bacteroidales bacterium]|jgi:polysaccharide export outer membrane protein|nr:polysaccharide biosynthesis/export family protein [Bacteroidales bacterium]
MKKYTHLFLILAALLMAGCVPQKKILLYQGVDGSTVAKTQTPPQYHVQRGDVLYIDVKSVDDKATSFINGPITAQTASQQMLSEQTLYFKGYEVGSNGAIQLPFIDSIGVAGLTMGEIAKLLVDSLSGYIFDPVVSVKLSNFRVAVNGEVSTPGSFAFYSPTVTIFDVLALARPTDFANRKEVVITRKTGSDSLLVDRIDLTNKEVLSSPYYYMQPGDQLYFEPLKAKQYGFTNFPYSLVLSIISTSLVVYTLFK